MPTKVVFETATVADSIKKAASVAPSKGMAFDKAAGILLDVTPDVVIARATNLEVFYMEWVDIVSFEGDPVQWRLPAQLLATVLGSLPIGSGKVVTFEQEQPGGIILVSQGRTKARFNSMSTEYYPAWTAFDPDSMVQAPRLADRLKQVMWAASSNAADLPFNGVHINGQTAVATDRYRCACVPLPIPGIQRAVTVPGILLAAALGRSGDVEIGIVNDQILIMPDEHSQVRAMCIAKEYPQVERIMKRDHPQILTVSRDALVAVMNRAMNFSGSDRTPLMRTWIGQEEIAVMMQAGDIGNLGDVVEIPGHAIHDRFEICFTPKNLLDALVASPNDQINIGYEYGNPRTAWRIDGGSGYEAWVMPRASGDVS